MVFSGAKEEEKQRREGECEWRVRPKEVPHKTPTKTEREIMEKTKRKEKQNSNKIVYSFTFIFLFCCFSRSTSRRTSFFPPLFHSVALLLPHSTQTHIAFLNPLLFSEKQIQKNGFWRSPLCFLIFHPPPRLAIFWLAQSTLLNPTV